MWSYHSLSILLHFLTFSVELVILLRFFSCSCNLQKGFTSAWCHLLEQVLGALWLRVMHVFSVRPRSQLKSPILWGCARRMILGSTLTVFPASLSSHTFAESAVPVPFSLSFMSRLCSSHRSWNFLFVWPKYFHIELIISYIVFSQSGSAWLLNLCSSPIKLATFAKIYNIIPRHWLIYKMPWTWSHF